MFKSITLINLVEWLNKQPKDRRFCFTSITNCLFANWFKDLGFKNFTVGANHLHMGENYEFPQWLRNLSEEFGIVADNTLNEELSVQDALDVIMACCPITVKLARDLPQR